VIFEPGGEKKHLFLDISSTNMIYLSHRFTCESKLAPFKSFYCVSANFAPLGSTSSSSAKHLPPTSEALYTTDTTHRKHVTFLYEYPLHWVLFPTKKKHYRTLLFVCTLLKHRHHFDYWNQPLNMHMRVCYLDCHEAGLCCYLVIHIKSLLHLLQLFYFHLWPIYWLFLVWVS
jgi:hypothetical protein